MIIAAKSAKSLKRIANPNNVSIIYSNGVSKATVESVRAVYQKQLEEYEMDKIKQNQKLKEKHAYRTKDIMKEMYPAVVSRRDTIRRLKNEDCSNTLELGPVNEEYPSSNPKSEKEHNPNSVFCKKHQIFNRSSGRRISNIIGEIVQNSCQIDEVYAVLYRANQLSSQNKEQYLACLKKNKENKLKKKSEKIVPKKVIRKRRNTIQDEGLFTIEENLEMYDQISTSKF